MLTNLKKSIFGSEPQQRCGSSKSSMLGAAYLHKDNEYVTHSTLHHSDSAIVTFTPIHALIAIAFIILSLLLLHFVGPLTFAILFVVALSLLYFTDLLFNLFIVFRSFQTSTEVDINKGDFHEYQDFEWPMYTIFCPLYKEAAVLGQFVDSIKNLDYPKNKLEVLLLMEEDDSESISAAEEIDLPAYIKVVVVPHSFPKTKPKAVNFGLSQAKGKYAVIYDAEDIVEPDQLKKAVIAFSKVDESIVCLQAKLNFYNARQNILTRLFTAEYSLWFDLILPGLQSISAPIPLGGTSNNFIVDKLNELEGWDPFNVTEDCDLGIRLWKNGYKTAVIDSTTWEEANSQVGNWFRQRSRWIKGYIQTILVQYKKPLTLVRENLNIHLFSFNLIVVGKVLSVFINPLMWLITLLYFASRTQFGSGIEALFPAQIYYIAVVSLVFGNFLYLYYMVLGMARRTYWDLIIYFPLIPLYWLMISAASWLALYQLIVKPHYWEKTVHGLHLNKEVAFNYVPTVSDTK